MSQLFSKVMQIRWADIDANRHLRHSAYFDYGAAIRMMFFSEHGLTMQKLDELQLGPVLFREEALFKREIKLEDVITVDLVLLKATPNYSRWSVRHHFYKADGALASIINLDGAWMDLVKRKLATPDDYVHGVFDKLVRTEEFEQLPGRSK